MFNPIKASKNIKDEFVSYILTSFSFSDENLRKQLYEELEKDISNGPFLEINDIFKDGKSIKELIDEGIISPLFKDLEAEKKSLNNNIKINIPIERALYLHQENAIRSIISGNNVIISTGTGSGKTNCFLIPVLNELLKEIENNTLGPGVRALFIYPMNALANDQLKNLRELLSYYPKITFGVYNGETKEDEDAAINLYNALNEKEKEEKLRHRLPNELLSRDEMKQNPPNILFTNYSMLEHLLFRPKDDTLFTNSDFRFIVLDEAHIYSGATGIETAILLRRLRARISTTKNTQFILTSATLGNGLDSYNDILTFANNLCGVEFKKENIITAERIPFEPSINTYHYSEEFINELADESKDFFSALKKYNIKYEDSATESEILYNIIKSSDIYQKIRLLNKNVNTLDEIKNLVNLDQETIVSFISLCNRAQKNNKLIIDARYHFFVRSLEGCYLAMSTNPKLFLTREKYYKENNNNFCVFEIAICDDCGKFAFVGKIENNHLVQSGKLEEKVNYYFLASDENNEICNDDDDYDTKKTQHYYLCKKCGAIIEDYKFKNIPCECGIDNYIEIVQAKDLKIGARCATCHTGKYQRFYLGNEAATSVLATSLYEELPELTYEEEPKRDKNDDNNIFFIKNNYKKRKSICRQFLAFSDGRQEAAKFACYLSKSYNEFLRRRGICQIVNEYKDTIINSVFTIPDFVNKLTSLFSNKKSFAKSNIDDDNLTAISQENAWVAMLNELARFNSPTSLTQLGILQFEYLGNTKDIISNIAKKYKTTDDIVKNLLNLLVFEIVKDGALSTNTDTDINDDDREYIFFTPNQKFISYTQDSKNKKNYITDWMPKFDIKNNTYHKTNKLYYIMKSLNIDSNESIKFLNDYFDYLKSPQYNSYCLLDNDGAYVMPAKYFRVKIAGDPSIKWYKCNKCGKISQFNINGHCISPKCNNIVEEINPFELNKDNHFAKLYSSNSMSPLFIKEHTAQLSKRESCDYQQQFIRKEINALSCSTTFEMGVDVGDLETVFLRDVPPLPSNYAQRAGRAGRSINAVAYALTFAKLSSHDLSYFKEPEKMICGKIMPPIFKLDNEKIIRRHIYDIALSMFFANNQDLYNHNDAEKFINEKGYIKFTNWLKSYPEELKDLIIKSIPNVNNLHSRLDINNFGWLDQFIGDDGIFTILLKEYENNINIFEKLIEKYKKNNDSDSAKMLYKCQTKLENYKKNKLIDFLARGNILPRYGFPIDTVELEQYAASPNIDKLKLNRDLQIAIAEYAPSSEVIADGNLYTSRYIKKSNISKENKEWYTAYIGVCPNCQGLNYSITPVDENGIICTSCGKTISSYDFKESIEPRSGFITEKETKKVPLTSQEKNYKSEDYYIGNKEAKIIEKHMFKFNGINITIESTTNDSLLVKSINYFYVCPKCGFSYAQDEIIKADKKATKEMQNFSHVIETINKHEGLFGPCDCYKLNRYFLHHTFNTDVAKIDFGCDTSDYDTMVSTMYAILNSISKYLNIERKDIKACLSLKFINSIKNYSIIIYDSVPGGAGHSRRLVTNDGKLLYNILKEALSNMKNCSCDPSCYNCLRSYENQKIHDKLNRHLVIKFLENFMGKIETIN